MKLPLSVMLSLFTIVGSAVAGLSMSGRMGAVPSNKPLFQVVTVQPGKFLFRVSGEYLKAGTPVDGPLRTIAFRHSFDVMKYQVSAADYDRCVADRTCEAANPPVPNAGDLPATGLSYRDAVAYAAWLSARTGENWRLPSDEEWAYAAAERYYDDALDKDTDASNPAARWLARYRNETGLDAENPLPRSRGRFGANSKGLFDMSGNVWEWTSTCYRRTRLALDGHTVDSNDNCGVRVLGGRHRSYMSFFVRDGKSGGCAAGLAPANLGLRLVRDPSGPFAVIQRFWIGLTG